MSNKIFKNISSLTLIGSTIMSTNILKDDYTFAMDEKNCGQKKIMKNTDYVILKKRLCINDENHICGINKQILQKELEQRDTDKLICSPEPNITDWFCILCKSAKDTDENFGESLKFLLENFNKISDENIFKCDCLSIIRCAIRKGGAIYKFVCEHFKPNSNAEENNLPHIYFPPLVPVIFGNFKYNQQNHNSFQSNNINLSNIVFVPFYVNVPFLNANVFTNFINNNQISMQGNDWIFDEKSGILTIKSDIAMIDYVFDVFNTGLWRQFKDKIKKIVIWSNVTKIEKNAFCDCKNLEKVEFVGESRIKKIDEGAFKGCPKLKEMNLPVGESIEIASDAFSFTNLSEKKSNELPKYELINENSWHFDEKNQTLVIENNDAMKNYKFEPDDRPWRQYADQIKTIVIGNNVTHIGAYAFFECHNLENIVTFDEKKCKLAKIGDCAFYGCDGLIDVTIPNSVTKIGHGAFMECSNLKHIFLSNNIKNIGDNVFWECENLRNITIPDSIMNIGSCVFNKCKNLKMVNLKKIPENMGWGIFGDCINLGEVIIPDGTSKEEFLKKLKMYVLPKYSIPENENSDKASN